MSTRILVLIFILAAGPAPAEPPVRELEWGMLVATHSAASQVSQSDPFAAPMQSAEALAASIVTALDGLAVRLPGFVVPLESDEGGLLEEFFLVPYFGACIHVPPPPPNQLVYVKLAQPFELTNIWDPFWVEGEMRAVSYSNDVGVAGYTLQKATVRRYEWPE